MGKAFIASVLFMTGISAVDAMPLHDLKVYLYECISESEGDYLSLYSSDPETLVDENIVIQDVLTGQIIEEDAEFSETGMYICYPAGVHPMALNVFMKDGEDYEVLQIKGDSEEYMEQYLLFERRVHQLLNYFYRHSGMDRSLLPIYFRKLYDIYESDMKYLE